MLRNSLILLTSLIFFNDQAVLGQGNDDLSSTIVQIHGSGSSATQRCFWHVMETLGGQTKITTRGTYRSVGSGAGVREFMGNITHPQNYFGSSDYPLPKENFDTLTNAGAEMVHLPVVMGAVAVFHSLPLVKQDDATKLNLTSCLIARMYKGEITDW
jgi:ABC-type phosphate transport system substrate-binding protein